MNKTFSWSKDIQSTELLDYSRKLRFNNKTKQFWFDNLGVKNGMKILEVGCGSGHFLEMIKQNFDVEVYGVDLDCGHIEFAKNSAKQKGLNINYQVADIKNLPFEDDSFDLIYSYTVVEHLPFSDFIAEQKRVLRPGGKVVIMTVEAKQQTRSEFEYLDEEIFKYFNVEIEQPADLGKYSPTPEHKLKGLHEFGFKNINVDFKNLLCYCPDNYFNEVEFGLFQIETSKQMLVADAKFVISHSKEPTKEKDLADCLNNINKKYEKRKVLFLNKALVCDYQTTAVCVISGEK